VGSDVTVVNDDIGLAAQPARVELCLHDRDVPTGPKCNTARGPIAVAIIDLCGAVTWRSATPHSALAILNEYYFRGNQNSGP
jgi:hypothetical protein